MRIRRTPIKSKLLTLTLSLTRMITALTTKRIQRQGMKCVDSDLEQLETLIADTLRNTEELQKLLEDLQQNLSESGELIESYESIM